MKKKMFLMALIATSMLYADDFYESNASVNLEETVISTTGFEEKTQNIISTVTVITSEDISKKNYKTVVDVLSSVGTLNMTGNTVLGSTIDLRGQGSRTRSNVQVLVDGVSLNSLDTEHGVFPFDSININTVERIEIISGGGAVVYGSGTSGGVINIITKNGFSSDKKISGTIGTEMGSYNSYTYKGNVIGQVTDNLQIGLDYLHGNSDNYREGSEYDKDNYGISLNYKIDNNQKINFKYTKYTNDYSSPAVLTQAQLDKDRDGASTSETDYQADKDSYSLVYDYNMKDNLKFNLLSSYYNSVSESSTSTSITNFDESKIAFKPKLNYEYSKGTLTAGYDYTFNNIVRDTKLGNGAFYDISKMTNSVFLNNRYDMNKLELITGYRYEKSDYEMKDQKYGTKTPSDMDKTSSNSAYSMGLNYLYSDSGKLYGKFESGYTFPDPRQYINLTNGEGELNNLQDEEFMTYEIGFQDYIINSLVKGAVYYTEKENEIRKEGSSLNAKFYNIDASKRIGGELSISQNIKKLELSESIAYVDAKVTEGTYEGKRIPYVSKITSSINATYTFNEKVDLSGNITYRDKYYVDASNLSGLVNDKFVTDIKVNYSIDSNWKTYAGINNLFNADYYNTINYSSGAYTYDPASERNYFIGFNYSF